MLEELCRNAFYHATHEIIDNDRNNFVRLKRDGKNPQPQEFKDFYSYTSSFTVYQHLPMSRLSGRGSHGNNARTCWLAWLWFNENAETLCTAYIKLKHGVDLRKAMRDSEKFEPLFDGFLQEFSNRRERFLEKVNTQLAEQNNALAVKKKTPQSHGGVANLLKVLTQTMRQQGSSIYTIAKVQYAVCMQAGIYIPEEFITDVLVANELMQEAEEVK